MAQNKRITGIAIGLLTSGLTLVPWRAGAQMFDIYGTCYQQPKSEAVALRYSLFGTLLPVGAGAIMGAAGEFDSPEMILIGTGLIIGPSLGYFYGGCSGRGAVGTGIRLGLTGLTLAGMSIATAPSGSAGLASIGQGWDNAAIVLLMGSTLIVCHAVKDITAVKDAVRKQNWLAHQAAVRVVPTYFARSGAGGVQLQLTF